jgi:hypothetical protein
VLLGWQRSKAGGGVQIVEGLFGIHVIWILGRVLLA